ncbi:hypothetical protein [Burkholderia sp. BCC0405]|uniref:hypothetical protein n=1 Tax=Burkholderia sp. BCC0405 TaxID=2676298 RepID=UPI00158A94E8|nr:hypothetical protein [Burkholderia sp. BCC0405]
MTKNQLRMLVRAIENVSDRDADSGALRRRDSTSFDEAICSPILSYLVNPYEEGYWELKGAWDNSSPLSLYLMERLGTLSELEKNGETERFLPAVTARKLGEDSRAELLRLTNRLSPINVLFSVMTKKKAGITVSNIPNIDAWIEKIDPVEFCDKFNSAVKIFEEKVLFDGFRSSVFPNRLFQIKNGLISFLQLPRIDGALCLAAIQKADVCAMQEFYSAIGVLQNATVSRVFAPDDSLFRPYFAMVSGVLLSLIDDRQISSAFTRALDYYEDNDFQHCVSTLGLIAEDYLQRIYVSLLREQIPSNLTLGQTLDRLHKNIDEQFPNGKMTQSTADTLFDKIRAIDNDSDMEGIKPILREFVSLIKSDRSYYGTKFDELTKPKSRRTPFPSHVGECLNELLKWRNAASHNSRVPLGAHEADRTLYCLVSLISWWQKQITTLDWSRGKFELIEQLVDTAKGATAK